MEEIKMKIRKGTEVRVRRTNQIATIEEVELIRKGGKVHKYCHLKTPDGQPDLWMDSEELADIHELCEVTFRNKSIGQVVRMELDLNHKTDTVGITVSAVQPDNLKEQRGYHAQLASLLLEGCVAAGQQVE